MQAGAGDAQRVQHLRAVVIGDDRAERRRALVDRDAQVAVDFQHFDLDDARTRALAHLAGGLPSFFARTYCAAIVAWPTNGTGWRGVKNFSCMS